LDDVNAICGASKVQFFGDGDEMVELAQFHCSNRTLSSTG
jgi:hypothetical protein